MAKLLFHIISGTLGLYLAARFVPGVHFAGQFQILLAAGILLGFANFFIKPILNLVTLPLRLLTLGIFGLVINMLLVWLVVEIIFTKEFQVAGFFPLLWTTLIIWIFNFFFGLIGHKKKWL